MRVVQQWFSKAVEDFFSFCLFFCVTEGYTISHCGGVTAIDWALLVIA